jgi:hypothetical protein
MARLIARSASGTEAALATEAVRPVRPDRHHHGAERTGGAQRSAAKGEREAATHFAKITSAVKS